jgi:hypothetical protein
MAKPKKSIGLPDPIEVLREREKSATEGNRKLTLAVDCLRKCLENIAVAEIDLQTGAAVGAAQLRELAVNGLNHYSSISGQSWRRHRVIDTRAGDRDLSTLEA